MSDMSGLIEICSGKYSDMNKIRIYIFRDGNPNPESAISVPDS